MVWSAGFATVPVFAVELAPFSPGTEWGWRVCNMFPRGLQRRSHQQRIILHRLSDLFEFFSRYDCNESKNKAPQKGHFSSIFRHGFLKKNRPGMAGCVFQRWNIACWISRLEKPQGWWWDSWNGEYHLLCPSKHTHISLSLYICYVYVCKCTCNMNMFLLSLFDHCNHL